jgi:hypothetical protein
MGTPRHIGTRPPPTRYRRLSEVVEKNTIGGQTERHTKNSRRNVASTLLRDTKAGFSRKSAFDKKWSSVYDARSLPART